MFPFLLCVYGYGAYMRLFFIGFIPALIGVSFLALYVVRAIRSLVTSRCCHLQVSNAWDKYLLLVLLGLALLSWTAGRQVRFWHCESIGAKAAPAIEALRQYRSVHGFYPARLAEVPEFDQLIANVRISVREGYVGYRQLSITPFDDPPDMIVYLQRDGCLCAIPLERPALMSFTRFYYLWKDSDSHNWAEAHTVWCLGGF
jgi:hypothetical protein